MKQFNQEEFKLGDNSVLYFSASWCGPCKQLGPQLDDLEAEYLGENITFWKVLVDDSNMSDVVSDYKVRTVPSLVLLRAGKEINRIIGAQPVTLIADMIDKILEDEF